MVLLSCVALMCKQVLGVMTSVIYHRHSLVVKQSNNISNFIVLTTLCTLPIALSGCSPIITTRISHAYDGNTGIIAPGLRAQPEGRVQ